MHARLYGCRHPPCTQRGGAECCGRTAHPAAGMCGWVPSPVPHTCLALSPHMTNAAHPRCQRQHTAAAHRCRCPLVVRCRARPIHRRSMHTWLRPSMCAAGARASPRVPGCCGAGPTRRAAVDRAPGIGLTPPTSAPGLGSRLPHLRRDWAHPSHICAGTGPTHRADVESVRRRERERDGDARGCELDGDGNGLSICSRHTRCTASRAEYYITTSLVAYNTERGGPTCTT